VDGKKLFPANFLEKSVKGLQGFKKNKIFLEFFFQKYF